MPEQIKTDDLLKRCREFVDEQSAGEWDDKTIDADAKRLAEFVRAENEALREALQDMVDHFKPFTIRPVGGENSAARLDQEAQKKAHAAARAALAQSGERA